MFNVLSDEETVNIINKHDCKNCSCYFSCMDIVKEDTNMVVKCIFYGSLKKQFYEGESNENKRIN